MKILLSWLEEFVDVGVAPKELAHLLTMAGSEVASVEEIGAHWRGVRIGRVAEVRPHPRADRLFLVEVDFGDSTATLVTAATNLSAGDKVPVVPAGGSLRPEATIQAVEFRGVRSEGMLCSGVELGISSDAEGIYVMEAEAPVGQELRAYLGDTILDLDLTPNRPDCLSVVGIAREVAALTATDLRTGRRGSAPDPGRAPTGDFRSADRITVEIRDPDLCSRYTAVVLEGVHVGPSPAWVRRRLHLSGVRPISNIVDVTNYVMLERGQPLHAFDAKKLRGGIIVRRADPNETIVTLDGEVRRLAEEMLVIADHEGAVAVAGIMGGLESEVDDATTTVVLESANFNRTSIRLTSKGLRLSTEASKRFDKGLDPQLTLPSALRAAGLMVELAGGAAGQGVADAYPRPVVPAHLAITEQEAEGLLGLPIGIGEMQHIFHRLGFGATKVDDRLDVEVPTFRRDVEGRADLAEELIRVKGYDLIPTTLPSGAIPEAPPEPYRVWEGVARERLVAAGFQEVITYSLVECGAAQRLTADVGPGAARVPLEMIPLINPMTPEQACLRTSLLDSLLRTAASNLRHERRGYLFELGRVYMPPMAPLPAEQRTLGIVLAGARQPEAWNCHAEAGDFFDLKGAIELLLASMGIRGAIFQPARHVSLHPGRTARLLVGDRVVGHLGEVHPTVVERYDLEPHRPFAAELDFGTLISLATPDRAHTPLPRFPAVSHDIAVVVDDAVPEVVVDHAIRELGAPLLAEAQLFDVYHGASIPPGRKSLAYSLTYRAADRTLTDEEVMEEERRIVDGLAARFGAYLRGR